MSLRRHKTITTTTIKTIKRFIIIIIIVITIIIALCLCMQNRYLYAFVQDSKTHMCMRLLVIHSSSCKLHISEVHKCKLIAGVRCSNIKCKRFHLHFIYIYSASHLSLIHLSVSLKRLILKNKNNLIFILICFILIFIFSTAYSERPLSLSTLDF
jgi:hypothetical protein